MCLRNICDKGFNADMIDFGLISVLGTLAVKKWPDEEIPEDIVAITVRARPGRLSGLSISHSRSVLHGAFVWARGALNSPKRWFPARPRRRR
jgi:hypothetical protein